jgi:ribonuclease BN (tRNA processing enzyme)
MFTPEDYQRMPHYGHSRPTDAVDVCGEAGAARLALFHHAPERTDAEVDAILADARAVADKTARSLEVVAAYEGLEVELGKQ